MQRSVALLHKLQIAPQRRLKENLEYNEPELTYGLDFMSPSKDRIGTWSNNITIEIVLHKDLPIPDSSLKPSSHMSNAQLTELPGLN